MVRFCCLYASIPITDGHLSRPGAHRMNGSIHPSGSTTTDSGTHERHHFLHLFSFPLLPSIYLSELNSLQFLSFLLPSSFPLISHFSFPSHLHPSDPNPAVLIAPDGTPILIKNHNRRTVWIPSQYTIEAPRSRISCPAAVG